MDSPLARYDSHQDDEEKNDALTTKTDTTTTISKPLSSPPSPQKQPSKATPVASSAAAAGNQNNGDKLISPSSSPSSPKTSPASRRKSPLLSLPPEIFTLVLHHALAFPDLPSLFADMRSRDQLAERIRQHTLPVGDLHRRNRRDSNSSSAQPNTVSNIPTTTHPLLLCNKALTRAALSHLRKRTWLYLAAPPAKPNASSRSGSSPSHYPLETFIPLSAVRRALKVEVHVDFSDLNRAMDWLEELFTIWEGGCAMQLLRVRVWSGDSSGSAGRRRGRSWGSEWSLREDRRKVRKGMWTEISNAGFDVPSYTETIQDGEAVDCKRRGISLPVR